MIRTNSLHVQTTPARGPSRRRSLGILRAHAISALALGLCACSGGDEADGAPVFEPSAPAPGVNPAAANALPANTPPSAAPQASAPSPASPPPANPVQTGNAAPASPPSGAPEGAPNDAPLNGQNTDTSGGAMAGAAGAGSMPTGNADPGTPAMTPPVATPVTPAATDTMCPAGAIFCSGFEGTGLPAGTRFEPDYLAATALGTQIALDTTVFRSGRQSLHMPVGSNYYRMLSVAVPQSFWVRLYTRSNVGFGAAGSTHATLFMGSIVPPGGDYNADRAVEVAEQFGQVLLNVKDSLYGTNGTNPNNSPGTRLPDNAWTCMEAQFDGASGDVQIFVEGEQIIDASGWQAPTNFQSFRFGYLRFDSPARDVWMDDVVVASSRVGCQ